MCRELEDNKKLTVFSCALGQDVNTEELQKFTKRRVLSIRDDKIEEFFEWLGRSVSIVAETNKDETDHVQLDPGFDQWMI